MTDRRERRPSPLWLWPAIGLLALVAGALPGCRQTPPAQPRRAQVSLEPGDHARLAAAVLEAERSLTASGVPLRLTVRGGESLDHGALLPLRHGQLPERDPLGALLTPLRERVRPLVEGCAGVCVVLVPEIAPASGAAAAVLPELAGLGLGPEVFAGGDPSWRALADAAGWQAGQGPRLALISARHLRQRGPEARAALVLHEVGHALGLPHTAVAGGVMTPTAGRAGSGAGSGAEGSGPEAPAPSGVPRLSAAEVKAVKAALSRRRAPRR